ncbi:MAG: leucine-rich repeat protein, partial [Peptococcaceae bacterium]|nr:leucine-rich repeat protein [Peptococcaceae bacterium]
MHKPLIRRLFLGCATLLLFFCSPVASASGNLDSGKPSKAEIQAMWQKVTSASAVFEEEPSVAAPYAAGKLTAEFLETGLTYTNYVRFVANLPLMQLNDTYNEDAQHGAVVLAANDTLTHYPDQPAGMDDAFYERASDATSSSNIFYCYGYSPQDILKVAVGCFMDDDDSNNNDRLGHRRWVLNPKLKSIGFGYAQSQSGSNYAVMKVFDRSGDAVNYDYIAWPAAGNFPTNLFASTVPWSITLNPSRYQTPELSQLKIVLTRKSDGTAFTFTESTGAPGSPANAFLNVDTAGYGVSNCIIFNPGSSNISSYSGVYTVDVSGIYTSDGSAATLHYEVDFFDVNNVCTSHDYQTEETPATCTTPGSIVKTCRNCGESTMETTAALGHNYVDGTCTRCKEADPNYVAPDDSLSGTCGENLTWVFEEETGTLNISGAGDMTNYSSDAPAPWRQYCNTITKAVITPGITSIGSYAFFNCTVLVEVTIPDSVTSIGKCAFSFCTKLRRIYIPNSVTIID